MSSKLITCAAAAVCSVVTAVVVSLAGPLDPPSGPVASTFKTLTEVEPRIAINATNTPGDADSVFKITQPGSYYLAANILVPSGKRGIEISSRNVTLDLKGFAIEGDFNCLQGVASQGSGVYSVAVLNGVIRGVVAGIDLNIDGARVEDISVTSCTQWGIRVGARAAVRRCSVASAGDFGYIAGDDAVIESSAARQNSGGGFSASFNALLRGCSASLNTGPGISLWLHSTAIGCTADENGSTGILVGDGAVISNCASNNNGGHGIETYNGSLVERNQTRNNQQDGIRANFSCAITGNNCNGDGTATGNHGSIRVTGQANRIDGNNISYADRGLMISSGGNVVVRNSVKGCTVNFDIVSGNDVGPIGSAATAASPWANLQF